MPLARPFFFEKYVGVSAILGMKLRPQPRPTTRPWAKMNCQYSVHKLVIMVPKTMRNVPRRIMDLQYPRSKSGPVKIAEKTRRKACIEPIHEILEDD